MHYHMKTGKNPILVPFPHIPEAPVEVISMDRSHIEQEVTDIIELNLSI